jgi:hypothetical protein
VSATVECFLQVSLAVGAGSARTRKKHTCAFVGTAGVGLL